MKAMYMMDNGKEHMTAEHYHSGNLEPLTMFFDFFDMIRNKDREYATYEVLVALEDETMNYEEACNFVPVLRFFDHSLTALQQKIAADLITVHDTGKEMLETALLEQRTHEESFFKTLLIRDNKKDHEFLGRFNLRKFSMPATNFGDWVSFNLNYINDKVVCCGKCDKCGTYYPIYRGGRSLSKNHYCPMCRNNVRAVISEKKAKDNPLYVAYRAFYQRYYAQFKRYETISYEQFKAYMLIAGNVRDSYLVQGKDDVESYQKEVESQIARWKYR